MTQITIPQQHSTSRLLLTWSFIKGAMFPVLALTLAVLTALVLGVQAAEDWDGFAKRIDLGKTAAFYVSIGFGALINLRAQKVTRANPLYKAQAIGLGLVLTLWLVLL